MRTLRIVFVFVILNIMAWVNTIKSDQNSMKWNIFKKNTCLNAENFNVLRGFILADNEIKQFEGIVYHKRKILIDSQEYELTYSIETTGNKEFIQINTMCIIKKYERNDVFIVPIDKIISSQSENEQDKTIKHGGYSTDLKRITSIVYSILLKVKITNP